MYLVAIPLQLQLVVCYHMSTQSQPDNEKKISARLDIETLDDLMAALIISVYLCIVLLVMADVLTWGGLPNTLQYWTTSAFVLSLGLIFGKRVSAYRRSQS